MIWAPLAGTLTFLRQCSPRCSRAPLRVSPGRLDRVGQARLARILRLEGFESDGLALGGPHSTPACRAAAALGVAVSGGVGAAVGAGVGGVGVGVGAGVGNEARAWRMHVAMLSSTVPTETNSACSALTGISLIQSDTATTKSIL